MFKTKIDLFGKTFLIALVHILFWLSIIVLLSQFNIMQFPNANNIVQWDAGWYQGIVKNGYSFVENAQCNIAFFPLFPLFWKIIHASPLVICIINFSAFFLGFIILSKAYSFNEKETLMVLSFPSLFFCYMPYSEALFFLSVSIMLYGFQQRLINYTLLGLFLAGLCRATSMLFLPAFFLIEFSGFFSKENYKSALKNIGLYLLFSIMAILCVAYIQYIDTGRWFDFLFVQKFWNKAWQLPKLPITTWDGARLIWIDGCALLISFIAFIFCIIYLKALFINKALQYSKALLFSLAYLSVIGLVTLFYSNTGESTSIYSLNRYVFATPFLSVFVVEFARNIQWHNSLKNIFFSCLIICVMLFGLVNFNLITIGFVMIFALYALSYLMFILKSSDYKFVLLFYIVNMFLQLKLFDWFLNGKWVG